MAEAGELQRARMISEEDERKTTIQRQSEERISEYRKNAQLLATADYEGREIAFREQLEWIRTQKDNTLAVIQEQSEAEESSFLQRISHIGEVKSCKVEEIFEPFGVSILEELSRLEAENLELDEDIKIQQKMAQKIRDQIETAKLQDVVEAEEQLRKNHEKNVHLAKDFHAEIQREEEKGRARSYQNKLENDKEVAVIEEKTQNLRLEAAQQIAADQAKVHKLQYLLVDQKTARKWNDSINEMHQLVLSVGEKHGECLAIVMEKKESAEQKNKEKDGWRIFEELNNRVLILLKYLAEMKRKLVEIDSKDYKESHAKKIGELNSILVEGQQSISMLIGKLKGETPSFEAKEIDELRGLNLRISMKAGEFEMVGNVKEEMIKAIND